MSKRRKKEEVHIPAMHLHEPINLVELGREWETLDEDARIQSLRLHVKDSETITDEVMRAAVNRVWDSSARDSDGETYYLHHIIERGALFVSKHRDLTEKGTQMFKEMAEIFHRKAPKSMRDVAAVARERGRTDIVRDLYIGFMLGYSDEKKRKIQQFIDEVLGE